MFIDDGTNFIGEFSKETFISDSKEIVKQFLDNALNVLFISDNVN